MKKRLVLFGTSDFAQLACLYFTEDSPWEVAAFTAHERYIVTTRVLDRDIVPFERLEATHPPDEYAVFVAIGFKGLNRVRTAIYQECKQRGYELVTYISSRATHLGHTRIGDNCFIFENNVIQPFVTIGNNVIVWSGNHIGHHSTIGDHCFIASHAVISGHVTIGESCFVGVNATFRDGVTVGPRCLIGAVALIVKDTVPKSVYPGPRTEPAAYTTDELRNF